MALDFLGDTSKWTNYQPYSIGDMTSNSFSGLSAPDYSLPTSTDTGSLWSNSLFGGGEGTPSLGGFNLGSLPWSKIVNTLGRLGSGIGSGISAYQSQQQPDYIPYTRWLGNGLAMTGYLNNSANKQNKLDQAMGAGNMLSNLFGQGFSLLGGNKLSSDISNGSSSSSNSEYNEQPFLDWLQQKQNEYGNQTMSLMPLENKNGPKMY